MHNKIENENEFFIKASNEEFLSYMIEKNIFKSSISCKYCGIPMKLRKTKDCSDGYTWNCRTYACSHFQTTKRISEGSVFEGFGVSTRRLIKSCLLWCTGASTQLILKNINLSDKTFFKLKLILINRIKKYFDNNPIKLGGPFKVVHVDETLLTHGVKSHRGRSSRAKVFAICIVEASDREEKGFVQIIPNRTTNELLPIINRVVLPGTVIHTDEWKSYQKLKDFDIYEHKTVCHKYNFVCPQTGVHTQNAESYNNKLKLKIKERKGIKEGKHEEFCFEFMWIDRFACNIEMLYFLLKFD